MELTSNPWMSGCRALRDGLLDLDKGVSFFVERREPPMSGRSAGMQAQKIPTPTSITDHLRELTAASTQVQHGGQYVKARTRESIRLMSTTSTIS